MKRLDLSGQTFGSLTAICQDENRHDKCNTSKGKPRTKTFWLCECSLCGRIVSVQTSNLTSGNTTGCGCDMYTKGVSARRKRNKIAYDEAQKCYVGITNNTGASFYFDEDDYEMVSSYIWYETKAGYIMTRVSKTKQIFLHRLVMFGSGLDEANLVVDHINRNPRDCRKNNLRVCTGGQNAKNHSLSKANKSGVTGVIWRPNEQKWQAYICVAGKMKSLGYYRNKEDAIIKRKNAEQEYYGEFAPK